MDEANLGEEAKWTFHNDLDSSTSVPEAIATNPNPTQSITWTGSEFVQNQKTAVWYLFLGLFIAAVCTVIYIIGRDIFSVISIVIMGFLFAVVAARKPRQLTYSLDDQGIQVGNRAYNYTDFKSFSIQQHGAIPYVNLLPLHRFHNELSLYFPPDKADEVIGLLSHYLPNDQRKETYVDQITKIIRF